jgi:hypothetical protein
MDARIQLGSDQTSLMRQDAPHAKLVLDRHETDQGGFGISDRRRCSYRRSYCSVIILGSDWVICGNAKIQNTTLALSNHFRIL